MKLAKRILKLGLLVDAVLLVAALVAKNLIRSDGDENADEFTRVAIMSGDEFASRAPALSHGRAVAAMGGIELDLNDAHLSPGAELTVLAVWGGVTIHIPPKWRVVEDGAAFMGDTRFQLDGRDDLAPDAPTLTINARSIMGGVLVTNRPRTPGAA